MMGPAGALSTTIETPGFVLEIAFEDFLVVVAGVVATDQYAEGEGFHTSCLWAYFCRGNTSKRSHKQR